MTDGRAVTIKQYIILGALCLGLCSLGFAQNAKPANIPPTVVSVVKVIQKTGQTTVQATGTLSAMSGVDLSPEVPGRITHIYFKSGQMVQKGDALIQIYADIAQADLDQQKAKLTLDQTNYQRYLQLYQKRFVDKADLDAQKAELDAQKAVVAQLQAKLDQTTIRAPFSGKIGLKTISIGQYVNPGDKLVSLQALDPIRVDFSIPETYVPQVNIGDKITITSRAFADNYRGEIYALNAVVDKDTRSLAVQASIPNEKLTLLPGMFVEVTAAIGKTTPSLIIPQTTVVYSPEGDYVYRVIDHKAVKTTVTLGMKLDDDQMLVTKGLKAGDVVVDGGQMKLKFMPPGAPVVTPEEMQAIQKKDT